MALIIDTETTGLPQCKGLSFGQYPSYKKLHLYDSSRVVQISMMICDEEFNQIEMKDFIVKADGFTINNSQFHGITNEISENKGITFLEVADIFMTHLKQVSHIVAHNADFDINVIKSELYRFGLLSVISELKTKTILCTMKHTKPIVKARGKYGIKYPSLAELYKFACGENIENAHNSKYDVINLHRAIKQLHNSNKLNYKEKITLAIHNNTLNIEPLVNAQIDTQ